MVYSPIEIALKLTSSGVAATLIEGGQTAHSAINLSLNMKINETPTCNLSRNCVIAKVLQQCKLFVRDESYVKMAKALDQTQKDVLNNQTSFSGLKIMMVDDFQQTLQMI